MNFDAYTVSLNGVVKYVGVTVQGVMARWKAHIAPSSACIALRNAIQKHGASSFIIEHVACARSAEELGDLEAALIEQYHTISPKGYNLKSGGIRNVVFSDEVREKLSLARIGSKLSDQTKERISLARTGKKFRKLTKETKRKMSIAHSGHPHVAFTLETRAKMRVAALNRSRRIDDAGQLDLL